jgi:hypothetical protein
MKYLCLIYNDEKKTNAIPAGEMQAVIDDCEPYTAGLKDRGQLIAAERLKPTSTATTLRLDGGKLSITDGPFAETKEQLGGFLLIDARDLDEAMSIASRMPPARLGGSVEVRPVWE